MPETTKTTPMTSLLGPDKDIPNLNTNVLQVSLIRPGQLIWAKASQKPTNSLGGDGGSEIPDWYLKGTLVS